MEEDIGDVEFLGLGGAAASSVLAEQICFRAVSCTQTGYRCDYRRVVLVK